MRGGPAVEAAAVALKLGWDPVRYASLRDADEVLFANLVLERAQRMHADEVKAAVEAVGVLVGNRLVEALSKLF